MRPPADQALFRAVRKVLLEQWDPIGVVEMDGLQDEYDSYIWPLVALLKSGAAANELHQYLVEIETTRMGGIGGDIGRLLRTVQFLRALPLG